MIDKKYINFILDSFKSDFDELSPISISSLKHISKHNYEYAYKFIYNNNKFISCIKLEDRRLYINTYTANWGHINGQQYYIDYYPQNFNVVKYLIKALDYYIERKIISKEKDDYIQNIIVYKIMQKVKQNNLSDRVKLMFTTRLQVSLKNGFDSSAGIAAIRIDVKNKYYDDQMTVRCYDNKLTINNNCSAHTNNLKVIEYSINDPAFNIDNLADDVYDMIVKILNLSDKVKDLWDNLINTIEC